MVLVKARTGNGNTRASKQSQPEKPSKSTKNQTDVILPTSDECMQQILNGKKNFEFRKYLIPETIERVWFYVKAPFSCIAYICEIEPGVCRLSPSFAPLPQNGFGNDLFNTRDPCMKGFDYAYYIKSAYRIEWPVLLEEMKERYGVGCAPRGMVYVGKKLKEEVWSGEGSRKVMGGVVRVFDRGTRVDEAREPSRRAGLSTTKAPSKGIGNGDARKEDTDVDMDTDTEEHLLQPVSQRAGLSHKRARSSISMDVSMISIKSRAKRRKV